MTFHNRSIGLRCGRQSDQIYATVGSCEEGANIRSPVVGSIVPDEVDFTFVGVSCFDLAQKLHGTRPIHGDGFDEGRVEIFQVQCPVDIARPRPAVVSTAGVAPRLTQPKAGLLWYSG